MSAMVINAQCRWLWCSLNARGEFTQDLSPQGSGSQLQHAVYMAVPHAALTKESIFDSNEL